MHCDLHLHLGGSISKDLLVTFAQEDKNQKALHKIASADVLQMFKIAHTLINSPKRIALATENVIISSTADYLDIRTTPRNITSHPGFHDYVKAFVMGLQKYPEKAKGLLSIDRYKHDIKQAQAIIGLAIEYVDSIVGIDISGYNPTGIRKLQGEDLQAVIETVLNSQLGLAIHIGELNVEKERKDSTITLETIDQWIMRSQRGCWGKIRLGHALYLEEEHKKIIRKHHLPIEICPSCHRFLGWLNGQKHPVQEIYTEKESPIVIGTDDPLIFSTDFKREMELAQKELPYNLANTCMYRFW